LFFGEFSEKEYGPLSEKVLAAVFEVSNTLGTGFLEKVYQRALLRELGLRGIGATAETWIDTTGLSSYFVVITLVLLCYKRTI